MNNSPLIDERQQEERDSEAALRPVGRKSRGSNSSEWLVNVADDVVVPMITSEVVAALHAGRLTMGSLVWRIGMHDWSALSDVPQLRLAAGPSPLPCATSTPGSVRLGAPSAPGEQRGRTPTPFGIPNGHADADAIAVYERPGASLTFSESALADWQGTARGLTPVPAAAARLTSRTPQSVAPHTLSPVTSEAEIKASARSAGWGDLSVVLASELRAVKKTSKRLILWAAVGSAVVASGATFWIARSSTLESAQTQLAPAARPAAPLREAEHAAVAASVISPLAPSNPAATAASTNPTTTNPTTTNPTTTNAAKPASPHPALTHVVKRATSAAPVASATSSDSDAVTEPSAGSASAPKANIAADLPTAAPSAAPVASAAPTAPKAVPSPARSALAAPRTAAQTPSAAPSPASGL
jgi:hypothetical protein